MATPRRFPLGQPLGDLQPRPLWEASPLGDLQPCPLWEASPLGDLTVENLRPEAGLPQDVPCNSGNPTTCGALVLTQFRDHLAQNLRSSKKPLTPSSQECAWGL